MTRRRLIWKVAPWYVAVIGLCTAAAAWYADSAVRTLHNARTVRELEHEARLIELQVRPLLAENPALIQDLCRRLGPLAKTRITIIDPSGLVLGDSDEDPAKMENHANRPEIITAYRGGIGQATRFSHTVNLDMMYVACPLTDDSGRVLAVVRTAIALSDLKAALWQVYQQVALAGLITAAAAVLLTLLIFRGQISHPLAEVEEGSRRFASGDLAELLPVADSREIGGLAESLNIMAAQLHEQIRTVTQQANERQAMLASMIEGVIALDAGERIIALNAAAARLLDLNAQAVRGRGLFEVVRHAELERVVAQTLAGGPVQGNLVLRVGQEDRVFDAQGAALKGAGGGVAGAVIVLHDVTQLRRLERVRQEFVANVSHELRTPITAIKAAVETLIDGFHEGDSAAAQRFLPVIARQADRLNAIVEDLLLLARLEQDKRQPVELSPGPVLPVLRAAVETCQAKADSRQITITVQANADLRAILNATLLEQAVVNLLDNAVKYCPTGSVVAVTAQRVEQKVEIAVRDNGPGIDTEHLPRLFERFYRPHKSRSRELGGTGLGLSIVKHVATVHGGEVGVESIRGQGSTFRIILPAA